MKRRRREKVSLIVDSSACDHVLDPQTGREFGLRIDCQPRSYTAIQGSPLRHKYDRQLGLLIKQH
eukprot:11828682-Alexandrium_andersonii.AAC.1